uniref:Uncharacterized protein n=1 Tax=Eutreptiella gymnastica TaxID=73025 RepID=A0A7S4LMW7_9EUGL|mmetsp:Transcript_84172/g.140559  ORF Transcript_84172/g.140559 Transcript_84172/m.140559 type:complete len:434 (-) Transcript_84172:430-1731(-)|eukprot:CAMPEP_0174361468 /NCGR_PEP_ID=MMETSP0811_2-20130205/59353_1 /TAXON_ID=73025 ORGANISM="Eutreptiella gymnastica-like, Strain CCMP1594" /NCGR_SAMPLE_ID=MMETSP0811_2 /ASSEMBLY_ACC=CAM_ASM_000667 /LENGTH=433 /DNA_ID=CAMNT_0015498139 /DNA_START=62 /DNA_END=1363 /DNA_ORIENTATION=+
MLRCAVACAFVSLTLTQGCASGEEYCLRSKYSGLSITNGTCYDPDVYQCCDTGDVYDPLYYQCCSVNGLQSIDASCVCSVDTDCGGGQSGHQLTDRVCCSQTAPLPYVSASCDAYAYYPSGTGDASGAPGCLGTCVDTRFHICCNGVSCMREYESCCNATCCNMYSESCLTRAYVAPSSANNWNDFKVTYDVCTSIEHLNDVNVFRIYIQPFVLSGAFVIALGMTLAFAGKVSREARGYLEVAMMTTAIASIVAATPLLFFPTWKYAVVVTLASIFAIITSAVRKLGMYITCLVGQFVLMMYLWDPVSGNDYMTLASNRTSTGVVDQNTTGLLVAISKMYHLPGTCTGYYNYFLYDTAAQDTLRVENPDITTFGYCSEEWIAAVLFLGGLVMMATMLQFVWSLLALVIRGGYMWPPDKASQEAILDHQAMVHH